MLSSFHLAAKRGAPLSTSRPSPSRALTVFWPLRNLHSLHTAQARVALFQLYRPALSIPPTAASSLTRLAGFHSVSSSSFAAMERNGEARTKRKASPVASFDRPHKHLKPEASAPTPGDATPQNGTVYSVENDVDPARMINPLAPPTDSPEWQATIESVVKSVVSIHFCQTCSFDTDLSMSSQATGFVVDAERGYILTNRHVACAGPFWGYCIFDNHEEVRSMTHRQASRS